jgi:hypothetical protein
VLSTLSKLSYKFSTNAIFILFSIIADILLKNEDFGKFIIIVSIQIMIFNFVDIFNIKYLLGEFSKNYKLYAFNKYFRIKIKFGILLISLCSFIYFIYDIQLNLIVILILTNYLQLLTSTISTYIFINEKNITLFIVNTVSFISALFYLLIEYLNYDIAIKNIIYAIFIYRFTEFIIIQIYSKKYLVSDKFNLEKKDFINVYPFYFQLLLSIGSSKLFILFLPAVLAYDKISLIGTYEYIIALPIFFISIITMTVYSKLFSSGLDIKFEIDKYNAILSEYYKKVFLFMIIFLLMQLIYIYYFKQEFLPYIYFILINDIVVIFSSIQGYLMFFWKMNKSIIYISVVVMILKNTIFLLVINTYELYGFFIFSLLVEIFVIIYIRFIINIKIKELN